MPTINTSVTPFANGSTGTTGVGSDTQFTFGGTWAVGDEWTLLLTDGTSGFQTQVGAGNVTGVVPVFAYTFDQKVYVLAGATTYFSAVGTATTWNDPNETSASFVTLSNFYNAPEDLVSMSVYQGRLAFFSRTTIEIYTVAANPAQWQRNQVLANVGTFAANSVVAYGDLDVYFLSDSGYRSLRVLETTLNATIDDVGSPIDLIIQAQLATLTDAQKAAASGFQDPKTRNYIGSIPNSDNTTSTLYCLSQHTESKVDAWSTWQATWNNQGTQQPFIPQNWVIFNGLGYTRDVSGLYVYGAPAADQYDNCVPTVISSYNLLDIKKPQTIKQVKGLGIVAFGGPVAGNTSTWQVSCSIDPFSNTFESVIDDSSQIQAQGTYSIIQSTTDAEGIGWSSQGTHAAFKAVGSGFGFLKFSEISIIYDEDTTIPG